MNPTAKAALLIIITGTLFLCISCEVPEGGRGESCSVSLPLPELKQFSFDFEGEADKVIVVEPILEQADSCPEVVGYQEITARYTRQELPLLLHDRGSLSSRGHYANFGEQSLIAFQRPVDVDYFWEISDFTLHLWLKPHTTGILFYGGGYTLYLAEIESSLYPTIKVYEDYEVANSYRSSQPLSEGWQHIALTVEGPSYNFYHNGQSVPSQLSRAEPPQSTAYSNIEDGVGVGLGGSVIGGGTISMDKIIYVNQVLSADEIRQLYQQSRAQFSALSAE